MQELFWVDVSQKHAPSGNTVKEDKKIIQGVNLTSVAALVDNFLIDSLEDLVDPENYYDIFHTAPASYEGNQNMIGYLTFSYDRQKLKEECLRKIKNVQGTVSITLQKPTSNKDLYEWTKNTNITNLDATSEGFDWGFCLLESTKANTLSSTVKNRNNWIKNLTPVMEEQGINNLCVFLPLGEVSESYNFNGKTVHFISTSNHNLSALNERISDNANLLKREIEDNLSTNESGPIVIQDYMINELNSNDASQLFQDGAEAINKESATEKMIGTVIERINLSMLNINNNSMFASSSYKISQPYKSTNL